MPKVGPVRCLTLAQHREIRRMHSKGVAQQAIAARFGVHQATVSRLLASYARVGRSRVRGSRSGVVEG